MTPPFSSEALQSAVALVSSVDLRRMQARVQRDHPEWVPERIIAAMQDYQRFLALCILCPEEELMPITEDMDHVWHAHILHTVQYAEDCERVFQEFLHHEPADTPFPPFELRERTRALYKEVFGIPPPEDDGFCSIDRLQHRPK